ncbi:hypothetical protein YASMINEVIRUS_982 [Yasminevirus sp. GU-2018]|uniref:Uncharacterized protein n=1 Tax=Yasminevirus sp. GU-2018 TaxID=2420051 RepID=A0A5K0U8P2_9VIRU|nr:hypothetical protein YASMINEVIRUS_982 [Yasminevirus sp. GU-2018]
MSIDQSKSQILASSTLQDSDTTSDTVRVSDMIVQDQDERQTQCQNQERDVVNQHFMPQISRVDVSQSFFDRIFAYTVFFFFTVVFPAFMTCYRMLFSTVRKFSPVNIDNIEKTVRSSFEHVLESAQDNTLSLSRLSVAPIMENAKRLGVRGVLTLILSHMRAVTTLSVFFSVRLLQKLLAEVEHIAQNRFTHDTTLMKYSHYFTMKVILLNISLVEVYQMAKQIIFKVVSYVQKYMADRTEKRAVENITIAFETVRDMFIPVKLLQIRSVAFLHENFLEVSKF